MLHASCSLLDIASEHPSWRGQDVEGHPDASGPQTEVARYAGWQLRRPGSLLVACALCGAEPVTCCLQAFAGIADHLWQKRQLEPQAVELLWLDQCPGASAGQVQPIFGDQAVQHHSKAMSSSASPALHGSIGRPASVGLACGVSAASSIELTGYLRMVRPSLWQIGFTTAAWSWTTLRLCQRHQRRWSLQQAYKAQTHGYALEHRTKPASSL